MAKAKKKPEDMTPEERTTVVMFSIAEVTRKQYMEMFAKHPSFNNVDQAAFNGYFAEAAHAQGVFRNANNPDQDDKHRYDRFYRCAWNKLKNYLRRQRYEWNNDPQKYLEHQRQTKLKKSGNAAPLPTTPKVTHQPRAKGPHPGPADPTQQVIRMPAQPLPKAFVGWREKFKAAAKS